MVEAANMAMTTSETYRPEAGVKSGLGSCQSRLTKKMLPCRAKR